MFLERAIRTKTYTLHSRSLAFSGANTANFSAVSHLASNTQLNELLRARLMRVNLSKKFDVIENFNDKKTIMQLIEVNDTQDAIVEQNRNGR